MIDVHDLEDAILEMAREDWCGLHEIVWRMNTVQPEVPEVDKITAARSVVQSLLNRGAIQIGWLTWPEARSPTPIASAETQPLLDNPNSWQPGQRYLVVWSDS